MIEIYRDESGDGRLRQPRSELAWFEDENEDFDDELGFFNIVVKKQASPKCPYDKQGQYVPRSKR